jgi:ligand-binding SRPBCC domain-containing protein
MIVKQRIEIERPPEAVFAYVTDTQKLPLWQKGTVSVERPGTGELAVGERIKEVHAVAGRRSESTVEVSEYARPSAFALHIVDGPVPFDGRWTFEPAGTGTLVEFTGSGELSGAMRVFGPVARLALDRQFRGHHRRLKEQLEAT